VDAPNHWPLAFVLDRPSHNVCNVIYGRYRKFRAVIFENNGSTLEKVDPQFLSRLDVLARCAWWHKIINEKPGLKKRVFENLSKYCKNPPKVRDQEMT
jgi:hypothetical protein